MNSRFAGEQGKEGPPVISMAFDSRHMIGMPPTDRNTVLPRTNRWLSYKPVICKEMKGGFS